MGLLSILGFDQQDQVGAVCRSLSELALAVQSLLNLVGLG